jgi:uncharacterized 2Fe-2S/4Fe-4S cluster protein (DUF4445 family)
MTFTIEFQPRGLRVDSTQAINGLDAARQAGINLSAVCGGEGVCGKCVIQLLSGTEHFRPSEIEQKYLSPEKLGQGYRLACQITLDSDIRIYIPDESVIEDQILQIEGGDSSHTIHPAVRQSEVELIGAHLQDLRSDFSRIKAVLKDKDLTAELEVLRSIPAILRENDWKANLWTQGKEIFHASSNRNLHPVGLAVDVGSTKIACYLMDLTNGSTLTAKGTPNPQIAYGEDIMTRLGYAMQGSTQAETLFHLTINAINQTAEKMCERLNLSLDDIADVCLVGNTAMHHFFLNLPTGSLAVSPFVPVTTDPIYSSARELGIAALQGAAVYTPPVIAGFIGSDHLAFLLAARFGEDQQVRLGIDIGTNTEIALQAGGRIVSVSTASGPAFEGAHIKHGMRAAPGAIEHVQISKNGNAEIQVIGNQTPIGICGSGILDAVAQMRMRNILNQRGRMDKTAPGVRLASDGKPEILLSASKKPITLSQNDIDQILLAKGAIRAGIDILLDHLKADSSEIEEIVIAGAFGSYMLPQHAMGIGMLPTIPLDRVKTIGNAAGTGARMMLVSTLSRARAEELANQIEYLELTIYPDFAMFYAKGIQA